MDKGEKMNTNEIKQFLTQAEKIGLCTMGELLKLCHVCKWKTNAEKINGMNDIYCRDWWETVGLIGYVQGVEQ